jgi:hypothetical protein
MMVLRRNPNRWAAAGMVAGPLVLPHLALASPGGDAIAGVAIAGGLVALLPFTLVFGAAGLLVCWVWRKKAPCWILAALNGLIAGLHGALALAGLAMELGFGLFLSIPAFTAGAVALLCYRVGRKGSTPASGAAQAALGGTSPDR